MKTAKRLLMFLVTAIMCVTTISSCSDDDPDPWDVGSTSYWDGTYTASNADKKLVATIDGIAITSGDASVRIKVKDSNLIGMRLSNLASDIKYIETETISLTTNEETGEYGFSYTLNTDKKSYEIIGSIAGGGYSGGAVLKMAITSK